MKFYFQIAISTLLLFLTVTSTFSQITCVEHENKMTDLEADHQISLELAEQVFEDYQLKGCPKMLQAYNFIGFAHYNSSNLIKAKEYFLLGEREYYLNNYEPKLYANNQMYTALVFIIEKNYEKAVYHLTKAYNISKKSNDQKLFSLVNQNFGLLQLEMGEFDQAGQYFLEALKYTEIDSTSKGYIFQNLAYLNFKNNNLEVSLDYIKKAKSIWQNLNDAKGIYLLSFIETKLAIQAHDYNGALIKLKEGRSAYHQEDKLLIGENYLIEAQIQHKLNNQLAQTNALKKALLEGDDLSDSQISQAIFDLSNLQESDETITILSQIISKFKGQNDVQNRMNIAKNKIMDVELAEEKSTTKRQLGFIIGLALLLSVLSYLFLKNRKQKLDIMMLNQNLKVSNKEIESQVLKLEQANKELEQFAYVASHDLKSPLRTISSFASLLKKETAKETQTEYLSYITQSSQEMSNMITDLLKHSLMNQDFVLRPHNLNEIINSTMPKTITQINDSKATIILDESCDININCDKSQISLVFQNLILNAINYCKKDIAPVLNISTQLIDDHLLITAADNGIGIPLEFQDSVFEMFRRLKEKDIAGTGIGLATCKKIIEKHHGTISLKSKPGEGSSFIIRLPNS